MCNFCEQREPVNIEVGIETLYLELVEGTNETRIMAFAPNEAIEFNPARIFNYCPFCGCKI